MHSMHVIGRWIFQFLFIRTRTSKLKSTKPVYIMILCNVCMYTLLPGQPIRVEFCNPRGYSYSCSEKPIYVGKYTGFLKILLSIPADDNNNCSQL